MFKSFRFNFTKKFSLFASYNFAGFCQLRMYILFSLDLYIRAFLKVLVYYWKKYYRNAEFSSLLKHDYGELKNKNLFKVWILCYDATFEFITFAFWFGNVSSKLVSNKKWISTLFCTRSCTVSNLPLRELTSKYLLLYF